MKRTCARDGYTIVEIMIVVTIIGILAGLAVPKAVSVYQHMRIKRAESDLQIIAAACNNLADDTGRWPNCPANYDRMTGGAVLNNEAEDLTRPAVGLVSCGSVYSNHNWQGPYIEDTRMLLGDPWGTPYFFDPDYTISGQTYMVVGSYGPNRGSMNTYDSDNVVVILRSDTTNTAAVVL